MFRQTNDWKRELQDIINRNNGHHAVKAKNVSFKTMHERANFLFAFFVELRRNDERNYKVLPSGLKGRHVQFMVSRWVRRELSPGTIHVYLSTCASSRAGSARTAWCSSLRHTFQILCSCSELTLPLSTIVGPPTVLIVVS